MGGRGGEGASWWRVVGKEKSWKAELFICAKIWLAVIKKAQRCSVYVCTSGRPKNWVGEGDTIKKKKKKLFCFYRHQNIWCCRPMLFCCCFHHRHRFYWTSTFRPCISSIFFIPFTLLLHSYNFSFIPFSPLNHSWILLKKKKEGKKRRGRFSIYK